jgi:hypothetical protein
MVNARRLATKEWQQRLLIRYRGVADGYRTKDKLPRGYNMQLPSLRASNKKNTLGPQAPKSLLPDNTPQEFRVLLSVCRVFLGTEETAKLEALLQQKPEWERLLALSNRHGVMPLLYRSLRRVDRNGASPTRITYFQASLSPQLQFDPQKIYEIDSTVDSQ